jgi:exosortase
MFLLFWMLALAWLPTRLVQEANPEWRLVSWALGLEVVGMTLITVCWVSNRSVNNNVQWLALPACFFLVAVPWPTLVERPLIEALSRANAATTVEVLNLSGLPAIRHGNVIEVKAAFIGIDGPCSGIRSLQAALMLSLFFGEFYRLPILPRFLLCFSALPLSFLFNVVRTTVLAGIAAGKGISAVGAWHDPTGVGVLLLCFGCLWGLAACVKKGWSPSEVRSPAFRRPEVGIGTILRTGDAVPAKGRTAYLVPTLLVWLIIAEAVTEFWYRSHENNLRDPVVWTVNFPREIPSLRKVAFSEKATKLLRYTEATNVCWEEPGGIRFQMIFLRWEAGRTAAHLAKSHSPEVCLTAAGCEEALSEELVLIPIRGLTFPFHSYVFRGAEGPLHVFHCIWEDRHDSVPCESDTSAYASRVRAVMEGRRNLGQRSLEIAIWGAPDRATAERLLASEVVRLIRLERQKPSWQTKSWRDRIMK